jgi:hypothetical protein
MLCDTHRVHKNDIDIIFWQMATRVGLAVVGVVHQVVLLAQRCIVSGLLLLLLLLLSQRSVAERPGCATTDRERWTVGRQRQR